MSGVLLNGLVAVPAGFALATALLPRRVSETAALGVALTGSALTFLWSVAVALGSGARLGSGSVDVTWVASLDVHWHLGADGISLPLVLLTTLVALCCVASLVRHPPGCGGRVRLAVLLLVIEAGVLGSFLALDMVLFFAFFEVALVPMWFVIDAWGDPADPSGRRRAATRFLVFTVLGSSLMLVGFLLVHASTGTFDIVAVAAGRGESGGGVPVAASVLIGLGLAVKTPLWPLHVWLPDAHAKAPTVGSVLLAAVLLKLGAYGFVRFWLPVTDPSWPLLVPLVAALGVVGIVYAALACLAQTDLKRLVAYSSVGHMGFVVLGVATFTVGGVRAAVFVSVAHGLVTGLLFFLVGAVRDRYGTTEMARLRVLYAKVPLLGGVLAFAAMASLGLPGLAGFWGEMLAVRAAVDQAAVLPEVTFSALAAIAALGVMLTTAYFLALLRGVLQGSAGAANVEPEPSAEPHPAGGPHLVGRYREALPEPDPAADRAADPAGSPPDAPGAGRGRSPGDLAVSEWLVWSPLIGLTVLFGLAPGLLMSPVGAAVAAFLGSLG